MKHTSGQCQACDYEGQAVYGVDKRSEDSSCYNCGPHNSDCCIHYPKNARLIAGAPELLEALKNVIAHDEITDGGLPTELVAAAKAAIAKAEGRVS